MEDIFVFVLVVVNQQEEEELLEVVMVLRMDRYHKSQKQLNHKVTDKKRKTILGVIKDIEKLKEGTYLSQQKLITDFIIVNE